MTQYLALKTLRAGSMGLLALLLACLADRSAQGETWAERLGYPADKKIVILQVREMGLCYETNAAGRKAMGGQLPISASVMAPCPWFADFAEWSAENRSVDVGLTLTLNSEWPRYRWQPLASDDSVLSLVDQEGFLWPTTVQTTVSADVTEVERELHAQILRAYLAGVRPSHFTSHLGALYTRPDLTQLYLRLARQYWIPAVVVEITDEHLNRFRAMGFPLPQEIIDIMNAYPLPKVDDLQFLTATETYDEKKRQMLSTIDAMPPGLTDLALHPAVVSDALSRIVDDSQQRVWEAQLLQDADVLARLKADDVVLTTWREIMQRFHGASTSARSAIPDADHVIEPMPDDVVPTLDDAGFLSDDFTPSEAE